MTAGKNAIFTTGSIMRHVSVSSFTASIGLMAIYAVDLIDLIFISMLVVDFIMILSWLSNWQKSMPHDAAGPCRAKSSSFRSVRRGLGIMV